MTVRLVTHADVPELVALMGEFYAESSFPLDQAWAAHAFASLIAEPSRGAVWIMKHDDAIAGHVVLSVRHAMESGGLSAYIDDLFVRPASRGRARWPRRSCRRVPPPRLPIDPG